MDMNYEIDYSPDVNIVSVKITGRLNFQLAEQYSKEAIKLARKNDCSKFLIDHSETDMEVGVTKLHTDGNVLEQFGFKNTDNIAIVISKAANDDNFPKDAGGNAKVSLLKYFDKADIKDALKWLEIIE
jgi:hypothetical protein